MPRVSVCTNLADKERLGARFSGENNNLDYCRKCYAALTESVIALHHGVSVDAVDMGADHPYYADDDYSCERCGKRLGISDE